MTRIALVLCMMTLCSAIGAARGAELNFAAEREIEGAYGRMDAAYARRDVPGILALYAAGFVHYDLHEAQDLAQTRRRLGEAFEGTQAVKAITRIKSLTIHRSQAEAIIWRRIDVTLSEPLPDLPPPYFKVEVNQEAWHKTSGGWLLTKMLDGPLRHELRLLGERDQALRLKMSAGSKDPALPAHMRAADAADRAQLKQIIRQSGWPGFDEAGTDGEQAAFLVTQHSDEDRAFQRQCLPLLTEAVRREQAMPSELALLTDRILRGEGKPQRYGTQFITDAQGQLVPQPIEDPAHVDHRRASVGLAPIAEYTKMIQQMYHPAPKMTSPKITSPKK